MAEVATNGHAGATDEPRGRGTRGPRYEAAVLGFRHYWYPGVLSRHLGTKPVAIKLLGEKVVDSARGAYVNRHSLRWRTAGSLQPAWSSFAGTEIVGPYLRQKRGKSGPPEADYPVVGHWPRYSWLRRLLAKVGKKAGRERPYPNEFRLPCMIHNKYFYYTHIRWAVPVDEHTTRNFQVLAVQYEAPRSRAFSLQYWIWHRWVFHMMFNGQDERVA